MRNEKKNEDDDGEAPWRWLIISWVCSPVIDVRVLSEHCFQINGIQWILISETSLVYVYLSLSKRRDLITSQLVVDTNIEWGVKWIQFFCGNMDGDRMNGDGVYYPVVFVTCGESGLTSLKIRICHLCYR